MALNPCQRDRDSNATSATPSTSRRRLLAAGGAVAAGGLSGCLGVFGESGEEMPAITYRHRYKRAGIGTGMSDAAVALGAWEDQDLDVSFETSSGSYAAAKSVASGKDMFGNGGVAAPLGLRQQGESLVILGQLYNPMGGVVSPGEHGIETWQDLEGKTVGTFPYGSSGPTAKAAMRRKGVDLSTINFQEIQPGSGYKLLVEGKIDAQVQWVTTVIPRLESNGYDPNVLVTGQVLDHLGVTLYTRREVVEDKPDVVERFVRGWLEAYQIFANRVEKLLEIYKPKAIEGFDEEIARASYPTYLAGAAPIESIGRQYGKGWIPPVKVDETATIFEEAGLLDGQVSIEDAYTNEFVNRNRDYAVETAAELYDRLEDFDVGPDYL